VSVHATESYNTQQVLERNDNTYRKTYHKDIFTRRHVSSPRSGARVAWRTRGRRATSSSSARRRVTPPIVCIDCVVDKQNQHMIRDGWMKEITSFCDVERQHDTVRTNLVDFCFDRGIVHDLESLLSNRHDKRADDGLNTEGSENDIGIYFILIVSSKRTDWGREGSLTNRQAHTTPHDKTLYLQGGRGRKTTLKATWIRFPSTCPPFIWANASSAFARVLNFTKQSPTGILTWTNVQ